MVGDFMYRSELLQKEKSMSRTQGKVKWFNEDKGYGFIERNDGGDDVFLHFNDLAQTGFKTIAEDAKVEFDVEMGPKGPKASNVTEL
jgi:CspA family cold shock protein